MSMLWIKRNTRLISLLEVALEPKKESEKSEKEKSGGGGEE